MHRSLGLVSGVAQACKAPPVVLVALFCSVSCGSADDHGDHVDPFARYFDNIPPTVSRVVSDGRLVVAAAFGPVGTLGRARVNPTKVVVSVNVDADLPMSCALVVARECAWQQQQVQATAANPDLMLFQFGGSSWPPHIFPDSCPWYRDYVLSNEHEQQALWSLVSAKTCIFQGADAQSVTADPFESPTMASSGFVYEELVTLRRTAPSKSKPTTISLQASVQSEGKDASCTVAWRGDHLSVQRWDLGPTLALACATQRLIGKTGSKSSPDAVSAEQRSCFVQGADRNLVRSGVLTYLGNDEDVSWSLPSLLAAVEEASYANGWWSVVDDDPGDGRREEHGE